MILAMHVEISDVRSWFATSPRSSIPNLNLTTNQKIAR